MDASELQVYEHQLSQVESALAADPSNDELKTLRDELVNLIDLTKSLSAATSTSTTSASTPQPSASASPSSKPANPPQQQQKQQSQPQHKFAPGEDCSAKYAGDGKWYPARIISVGGSPLDPVYSVVFKGYKDTEMLKSKDLRPVNVKPEKKEPKLTPEEEAERERRRRRSEKKTERYEAKQAAQVDKQQAWQKFAQKGAKKGIVKTQKSIFKTPDDPYAKVGVVGAGRGMTSYQQRSKHVFDEQEQTPK